MTQEDVAQVAEIERFCFTMPWPTSAYRRELKTPETNRYIVVRYVPPEAAAQASLQPPTESSLTLLAHPELHPDGYVPMNQEQNGHSRSLLQNLLPWLRGATEENGAHATKQPLYPIVGYAGLWLMVDEGHVTTIGVHPSQRGHGAGELLFLGLFDIAREMKAHRVTLEVRVTNTGAQALYKKYGMEIAGLRKRYYSDNGEDAYIMWSELLTSPECKLRIARLRADLTRRLQLSFAAPAPPAHPVDSTRLQ
ncbi:MAG: ribosomal protein S18-alanine N-acetyltransferase [Chloroflexota bacterium]|nr:ribosomal protein S18-alanine N-acetyltransferase [Chloroflexota bacterium]